MLVLTRKPGERIVVPGCELVLTVLAVNGKTVRLGITAPAAVPVRREEARRRGAREAHPPPKG